MMQTNNIPNEDEIDLRELVAKIVAYKKFIFIFTFFTLCLSFIYLFFTTPKYEVKSYVKLGVLEGELLNSPKIVEKRLNIIFDVGNEIKNDNKNKEVSKIKSIKLDKKVPSIIEIITTSITNEKAFEKNQEVISYIKKLEKEKIDIFKSDVKDTINLKEKEILKINKITIPKIKREIYKLNEKSLDLDKKIDILNNEKIVNLNETINIIKKNIKLIDQKINFALESKKINNNKINFYKSDIKKYSEILKKLNEDEVKNDTSNLLLIKKLDYINLVSSAQNNIYNLSLDINKIAMETIPNLKKEKDTLIHVTLVNTQNSIKYIKNVEIPALKRQKVSITKDNIVALKNRLNITLKNHKIKLENTLKKLRYQLSNNYIKPSEVVGDFIINKDPVKPKKLLILVVSFITGLILSIFLIFALDFYKSLTTNKNR